MNPLPDPSVDDPEFGQLLASLPAVWAEVPAEQSGEEIAFAFVRAAYGRGYVRALGEAA